MHEAGHAVITYRLGSYLGPVTIRSTEETLGASQGEGAWGDGSRDEEEIVALYTGLAAQRLVELDAGVEDGAMDDYEKADAVLASGHVEKSRESLECRAADLVSRHRAEIDAVATALEAEETLDGDEQEMIILAVEEDEDWRTHLAAFRRNRDWQG